MTNRRRPHDLLVAFLLVQNLLERRSEAFFEPFGLNGAQFNILNLLATKDGRMEQGELVELLLVGKSSISIVLNRMAGAGLIRREEHPKDRRRTVLVLTPKACALWKKVSPRYQAIVDEVFGAVPVSRRGAFLDGLKTINDALLDREMDPARRRRWVRDFVRKERA